MKETSVCCGTANTSAQNSARLGEAGRVSGEKGEGGAGGGGGVYGKRSGVGGSPEG